MPSRLTVDAASLSPVSFTHVLRGAKDPVLSSVTVNGRTADVSDGAWYKAVTLARGKNTFAVVGTDALGMITETINVEIEPETQEPLLRHVYNEFDSLGVKIGVPRLPGEKNAMYRRRLFEATEVRLGSDQNGLLEAMSIELGLKADRVSFRLRVARDVYDLPKSSTAAIQIRPTHVAVTADEILVTDEVHTVEPGVMSVTLAYVPRLEQDVKVYTENGSQIPVYQYKVHRRRKQVRFLDPALANTQLRFAYQYESRVAFESGDEIDVVTTGLAAVSGSTGLLLDVQIVGDGDRAAVGLPMRERTSLDATDYLDIPSYRVQVYELHDDDYYESLLVLGSAEGTLLEEHTSKLSTVAAQTWDQVVLDRTSWVSDADKIVRGFIAPITDAPYGYWKCSYQGDPRRYTRETYDAYSGSCPFHTNNALVYVGVENWQNGVGGPNDLTVDVVEVVQENA